MHTNKENLAIKINIKERIDMVWWTIMALVHRKEYTLRMVDAALSFYLKAIYFIYYMLTMKYIYYEYGLKCFFFCCSSLETKEKK